MDSKVFNNAKWIIVCRVIQAILSLVISMLSARYLGPSNFGIINYAASVVAFVVPIMYLGINNILVQELIANPDEEGKILGTSIILGIISSIFCIIGVTIFGYLANPGEKVTVTVCLLYSTLLFFQAIDMLQYWFQAKLLSKYTSVIMLVAYGAMSLYKIFLLITQKNVLWFALSNAFDYFIIAIGLFAAYKMLGGQRFEFSTNIAKRLFSKSKYYIVSSMMVTIFAQTDKIMIKAMIDESAVGYYSAAVTCAGMTSFVFSAIIDSMRPIIFEAKKISQLKYEEYVTKLYTIIILLALLQSIFIMLFAKFIIFILFGSQYILAVSPLRIIVWYTTFSYIGAVRNIWILAENKHKYLWVINLSGAVTNIILNLALIPTFGINGAAIASLITQIFTNVIIGYIIRPIRDNNRLMFNIVRIIQFSRK